MQTRIVTLAAALLLALIAAVGVSASSFVPGPLVQVSRHEPVRAAVRPTTSAGSPGTVYPHSEVEPWLDVNPTNTANIVGAWQQDRWSNGGARGLRGRREPRRRQRPGTQSSSIPGITICSGGDLPARRPIRGSASAPDGVVHQLALSFNDVAPPFTAFGLRPRVAGQQVRGRQATTWCRSGDRHPGPRRQRLQRQAVDHRRPDRRRPRLCGVGPPGLPDHERASVIASFPPRPSEGPCVVRPIDGRRRILGAGAPALRPRTERPDDRQPDRRPARRARSSTSSTRFTTTTRRSSGASASASCAPPTRATTWSAPVLIDLLGTIFTTDPETGDARTHRRHHPGRRRRRRQRAISTPSGRTRASAVGGADANRALAARRDGGLTWSSRDQGQPDARRASPPATSRPSRRP